MVQMSNILIKPSPRVSGRSGSEMSSDEYIDRQLHERFFEAEMEAYSDASRQIKPNGLVRHVTRLEPELKRTQERQSRLSRSRREPDMQGLSDGYSGSETDDLPAGSSVEGLDMTGDEVGEEDGEESASPVEHDVPTRLYTEDPISTSSSDSSTRYIDPYEMDFSPPKESGRPAPIVRARRSKPISLPKDRERIGKRRRSETPKRLPRHTGNEFQFTSADEIFRHFARTASQDLAETSDDDLFSMLGKTPLNLSTKHDDTTNRRHVHSREENRLYNDHRDDNISPGPRERSRRSRTERTPSPSVGSTTSSIHVKSTISEDLSRQDRDQEAKLRYLSQRLERSGLELRNTALP
ncbi:hypothetical protein BDV11DRAFT_187822 [Aspergillus similis]